MEKLQTNILYTNKNRDQNKTGDYNINDAALGIKYMDGQQVMV